MKIILEESEFFMQLKTPPELKAQLIYLEEYFVQI